MLSASTERDDDKKSPEMEVFRSLRLVNNEFGPGMFDSGNVAQKCRVWSLIPQSFARNHLSGWPHVSQQRRQKTPTKRAK